MLGKLIKHEFRATSLFCGLLFAGLIALAALSRLFMLLERQLELFSLPLGITFGLYCVFAFASMTIVYVIIARRFYVNVYGDEGYLTLTLPVKRSYIILSKLIVGMCWLMAQVVVIILSLLILTVSPQFIKAFWEVIAAIELVALRIAAILNMPIGLMISELAVLLILTFVFTILMLYASISIGQLFTRHRLIGSVIGYMLISAVTRIVMQIFWLIIGLSQNMVGMFQDLFVYGGALDHISSFSLQVDIILYILIYIALTFCCYLLTHFIMSRSVNLQ